MVSNAIDLSTAEMAYGAGVILVAAYIRGLAGFALSAIIVSGLSFIIEPIEAVALALIAELAASSMLARSVWDDIDWSRMWVLLGAGVIGTPIGVQVLTTADSSTVRTLTFGFILAASVALLTMRPRSIDASVAMFVAIGIVAGVANGAAALSGLVIVLALSFLAINAAEIRATLVAYFFAANVIVVGFLAYRGGYESATWWRLVFALPLLAAALWAGAHTFGRSSPERLRKVTLGVLVAVSLTGLVRLAV